MTRAKKIVGSLERLLLVLGAASAAGCYTYVPVQQPMPRSEVRVTVPARQAIERPNQAPGSFSVEGVVVSASDTLLLETKVRREMGAFREVSMVDTLRVPMANVLSIEEKVFSQKKSVGLGVVVAGGAALLAAGILSIRTGSQNGGPGGDDTTSQFRLDPLFRPLVHLLGR